MKITVLSGREVVDYKPLNSASLIRIFHKTTELEKIDSEKYEYILEYYLADIESAKVWEEYEQELNAEGLYQPTESSIQALFSFLKRCKDSDELVIHCLAGISRSPAVAYIACWFYNDKEMEQQVLTDYAERTFPNPFILERFKKELNNNIRRKTIG